MFPKLDSARRLGRGEFTEIATFQSRLLGRVDAYRSPRPHCRDSVTTFVSRATRWRPHRCSDRIWNKHELANRSIAQAQKLDKRFCSRQTGPFLDRKESLYLAPETIRKRTRYQCPQKTKKDRILSNFTKIENTPNRTGADAARMARSMPWPRPASASGWVQPGQVCRRGASWSNQMKTRREGRSPLKSGSIVFLDRA